MLYTVNASEVSEVLACHAWLAADFFSRSGWSLTSDGHHRWAVRRDGYSVELPAHCGHDDCPTQPTTTILKEAA